MAHINKKALVAEATSAARRAGFVVSDPAVVKAAHQTSTDFVQFARSANQLFIETQAAWHRSA